MKKTIHSVKMNKINEIIWSSEGSVWRKVKELGSSWREVMWRKVQWRRGKIQWRGVKWKRVKAIKGNNLKSWRKCVKRNEEKWSDKMLGFWEKNYLRWDNYIFWKKLWFIWNKVFTGLKWCCILKIEHYFHHHIL